MAQYNFWTSQGFIQTSTITRYNTNGTGTTAITTTFGELHKYPLPDTTIATSSLFNYNTSKQLFGFNRGNDVYSLRYLIAYATSAQTTVSITIGLFKGTNRISNFYAYECGAYDNAILNGTLSHFFICQPLDTSGNSSNVTLTIRPYTTETISINGNSRSTNSRGGFAIGFCSSNYGLSNSYMNNYNPSSNGVRTLFRTCYFGNLNNLTNISEYPTALEYICGKNVKYVGDDDISTTGGGFGTGDDSSDTNLIPDTEDITQFETESALLTSSGLFTTHIMSTANLQSLATFLWDTSIITSLERLFKTNPIDVIVDLKRLPITLTSTWTKDIYLGTNDTNINTQIVSKQYVTVNCGTLYPKELWGSSIDYSPHTKMMIYLPFIGFRNINVDYFMNQGITVKYIVDVLSGDLVCFIMRTSTDSTQNVIYTFSGNCAIHYPLSGSSNSSMILASGTIAKSTISGAEKGGQIGGVLGAITGVGNTIGSKPEYNMSDGYNSNMGFCGIMIPYLLIERPIQSLPSGIENYSGFPSNITAKLSTLSGFTKIQDINLNVTATEKEKTMIVDYLKKGVII